MEANNGFGIQLPDAVRQLPLKQVQLSVRTFLATWLNPTVESTTRDYISQYWVGLAELMNFEPQTIRNFEMSSSPTIALLQAYENMQGATMGNIWDYILDLGRYDILENPNFVQMLEREVIQYRKRLQNNPPLQVSLVSSVSSGSSQDSSNFCKSPYVSSHVANYVERCNCSVTEVPRHHQVVPIEPKEAPLVVQDVLHGSKTTYDAFVSFCADDFPYVKVLMNVLEMKFCYKLCINIRDLLPGSCEMTVTADIIAQRCRKVLLLFTPNYLNSKEYEFQSKIALSLSPGAKLKFIVPMLLKPCVIPLVFRHVCPVDNTRGDLSGWFWERLVAAIKSAQFIPEEGEINRLKMVQMSLSVNSPMIELQEGTSVNRSTLSFNHSERPTSPVTKVKAHEDLIHIDYSKHVEETENNFRTMDNLSSKVPDGDFTSLQSCDFSVHYSSTAENMCSLPKLPDSLNNLHSSDF